MQTQGDKKLNNKRIAVSGKRQITIPIEFFKQLGIENEVECHMQGESLIIRRAAPQTQSEFAEQILADLIEKGLQGEELMKQFRKINRAVRPAVEELIADADRAASGKTKLAGMSDVFGQEKD